MKAEATGRKADRGLRTLRTFFGHFPKVSRKYSLAGIFEKSPKSVLSVLNSTPRCTRQEIGGRDRDRKFLQTLRTRALSDLVASEIPQEGPGATPHPHSTLC